MRCPNCGSKMIYPSMEHKNFSGGKAVAGMIAFGVIGGAAGFIGKDIKGYKCSACGAFSQEAMSYSTETAINSAINAAKHNNDFSQYNVFKETYQNLEQIIPTSENRLIKNNSKIPQSNSSEEVTTKIKRTYKPNLYVCDCPIFVEAIMLKTRDNKDFLSFIARNKSSNTIRSAYFHVKVLDDAGDQITESNCVFQGLSVSFGENLPVDKEFSLNTDFAFKVDFKCVKVTFVDDSVWRDDGKPVYTLSEQDVIFEENFSKYKALKLKFTENKASNDAVIYQPVVTENYVQCVCGYPFNPEERCFNCGRNVEDIAELISFEILENYEKEIIKQRAQSRYLECKKFRDDALERNYSCALSLMKKQSISSIDEAISIFSKIEDYKDSKEQIKSCYEHKAQIKEKQEKEEAERLEAERLAEEERIAEEKANKKKRKTIMGIVSSATCAVITFVIVLNGVIIPNSKYNNAIALMEEGKYAEAIAEFRSLEGYRQSLQKIEECNIKNSDIKYNNALKLIESEKYVDAYEILITLGNFKKSDEKAKFIFDKYKFERIKSAKVGDNIILGVYEQDINSSNNKENIEWTVLEIKDNRMLLISKSILDLLPYNKEDADVTWETCTLREWLNKDFFDFAFSNAEKQLIPTVTVSADSNPLLHSNPGKTTKDKIFLFSSLEVKEYLKSIEVRKGQLTDSTANCYGWWLRSPGRFQNYTEIVSIDDGDVGDFHNNTFVYNEDYAVRPAMWIDLSKIK